jgi:hypothetical protein
VEPERGLSLCNVVLEVELAEGRLPVFLRRILFAPARGVFAFPPFQDVFKRGES